jgi:drug/metabolite transporter (DMT)-like permease
MTKRGWLLFAAMGLIWGVPYLLIRIAVRTIPPPTLVFFRTGGAGLAFLPMILRPSNLTLLMRRWRPVLLYTVLEVATPWLLLSRAEQQLTSSLAGLLIATVPLIAVTVSWVTHHEGAPTRSRLAGLILGFSGVAVIVGIDWHGPDLVAISEVLGTALCYAVGPFVAVLRLQEVPIRLVIGASLVLTGIGYAPYGLTHLPQKVSPEETASVVLLAVFCTAIAFLTYFQLIAEVGPARATVITYVNPAVAVVLGVLILNESVSPGLAAGIPLVLFGSVIGTLRQRPGAGSPIVSAVSYSHPVLTERLGSFVRLMLRTKHR